MVRVGGFTIVLLAAFLACSIPAGEPEKKTAAGPRPGEYVPASFDCLIVKGRYKVRNDKGEIVDQALDGRQRCLVCQFGLLPTVLVFVREPEPPVDWDAEEPLAAFFASLDKSLAGHEEWYLKGAGIFLSASIQSSVTVEGKKDEKYLVAEAIKREEFLKKLKSRSEKLTEVMVACYPKEGPADFKLDPGAAVTILFYHKHKVLLNESFAEGKFTAPAGAAFLAKVDSIIGGWKKAKK